MCLVHPCRCRHSVSDTKDCIDERGPYLVLRGRTGEPTRSVTVGQGCRDTVPDRSVDTDKLPRCLSGLRVLRLLGHSIYSVGVFLCSV